MAISWFCQWEAKDGSTSGLDEHDHRGLLALLRGCPRLLEAHVMTPVDAHDPHYAADLHKTPKLVIQLEFAQIADLETNLRPHGYLQTLANPETLQSLAGTVATHQAMLTRRYPVAEPHPAVPPQGFLSYMVEYEGPAQDENAWHLFYVEGHPPLLAKFPGIRKIEIYTPATLISALPFAQRRSMQRNKTVFDSADAMNAAMASPVRAALRKDFHKFPIFSGGTDHFPFRTVTVRGDRQPQVSG